MLINFGAGFSMYPFLLDEKLINIEIDQPNIIEHKKQKIEMWQGENKLPQRDIHYISVNFSDHYEQNLLTRINSIKGHKRCFILLEGVLFFLNRKETEQLFDFFDSVQNEADFIGSVSFQKGKEESMIFKRLIQFLHKTVPGTEEVEYQTVGDEFYKNRKGYRLTDQQDYYSLSKTYQNPIKSKKEMILDENFYLLEKIEA